PLAEQVAQSSSGVRIVAPHAPPVGKGDLRRGNPPCLGLFEVACSAAEELRELLRAADLARHLVAQCPTPIARQAALSHRTALDLLATHRLDGVAPNLDHRADAHASP